MPTPQWTRYTASSLDMFSIAAGATLFKRTRVSTTLAWSLYSPRRTRGLNEPADVRRLLEGQFRLIGARGIVSMIMAGVDIACWDALAIAADLPLATLLGAPLRANARIQQQAAAPANTSQASELRKSLSIPIAVPCSRRTRANDERSEQRRLRNDDPIIHLRMAVRVIQPLPFKADRLTYALGCMRLAASVEGRRS